MSRVLPSTLLKQQSFRQEWLTGSADIPSGMIVGIQVTATIDAPIALGSLSTSDDGKLSMALSVNGNLAAYCTDVSGNSITELIVVGSTIASATIETGHIISGYIAELTDDCHISKEFITVLHSYAVGSVMLDVIRDGEVSSYTLEKDTSLNIASDFTVDNSSTGDITISLDDDTYRYFMGERNELIMYDSSLRSINGVTSSDGVININIYYNGMPVTTTDVDDNWVSIDSSMFSLCNGSQDVIDRAIAPNTHAGYLPLDDMYDKNNVRDTAKAEDWEYGGFIDNKKISLFSVDENIDGVVVND